MLISRSWLESLLLPTENALNLSDAALGEAITSLGLEVETITRVGEGVRSVIAGRVESLEPHPQADKLRIVGLFDGDAVRTVVCGAPNVPEPGGLVAFAPLGSTLPGNFEIAPREIRGVGSEGMICAEDELGIGPDGDGILILPDAWSPGDRLIDRVPGIVDTIYELGITPNRPDALGHIGVARDLALKLGRRLRPRKEKLDDVPIAAGLVANDGPERCGRYIGLTFKNAKVKPSPLWMRVRLHRVGLRPINNVVDITNYVLFEWGQPLHAFDRDQLLENRVMVRQARAGETLKTLDDQTLELVEDDLVIADASRPQALAGVMGGQASGVTMATTALLLETAWFQPSAVRRTSRRHKISSDSSYRFERGVDFNGNLSAASARARTLLEELAEAECTGGLDVGGRTPPTPQISLRPARITLLLGMDIPDDESLRILEALGVAVDPSDPGEWVCLPPSFRPDLQREEDLIEEVMRHHGLDALPATPMVPTTGPRMVTPADQLRADARWDTEVAITDALRERGLHEHISLVFVGQDELAPFVGSTPIERAVELQNPMRVQASHLRTHMLPGLLRAASNNAARHAFSIGLFELGRVYAWPSGEGDVPRHSDSTAEIDRALAIESARAAVLLSSGRSETHVDATSVANALLGAIERLGVHGTVVTGSAGVPWLHPGVQAEITVEGIVVGRFGECHPSLTAAYDLPDDCRAYYGELDLEGLPAPKPATLQRVPRFPGTSRDVSIDLDARVTAQTVREAIDAAAARLQPDGDDPVGLAAPRPSVAAVALVEDYRGQGVRDGRRALLLRLHYGAATRSVTDEEVQAFHQAIIEAALEALRVVDKDAKTR